MEACIVLEYEKAFSISLFDSRGKTPLTTIQGCLDAFLLDDEFNFYIWDQLEHFAAGLRRMQLGPAPIRDENGFLLIGSCWPNIGKPMPRLDMLPIRIIEPCGTWIWAQGEPIPGPRYIEPSVIYEEEIPF